MLYFPSFRPLLTAILLTLSLASVIGLGITFSLSFYSDKSNRSRLYQAYVALMAVLMFVVSGAIYVMSRYDTSSLWCLYFAVIPFGYSLFLLIKFKDYKMLLDMGAYILLIPAFNYVNEKMYLCFVCVVIALSLFRSGYACYKEFGLLNSGINHYSIKNSLDSLSDGVFLKGKTTVYQNEAFRKLITELGINKRLPFNQTWNNLQGLANDDNANTLIIKKNDESYMFTLIEQDELSQIIALNITKEVELLEVLKGKQEILNEQNAKLMELIDQSKRIAQETEIERVKIVLHDVLGQRLSIIHQVLETIDYRDYDVNLIKNLIDSMTVEIGMESEETVQSLKDSFINSFKMINFDIEITGELPSEMVKAKTLLKVIRECATNAIKHANATKLFFVIEGDEITISDNGIHKAIKVVDGTGLAGIRRRLSQIDAELKEIISNDDNFILKLKL